MLKEDRVYIMTFIGTVFSFALIGLLPLYALQEGVEWVKEQNVSVPTMVGLMTANLVLAVVAGKLLGRLRSQ